MTDTLAEAKQQLSMEELLEEETFAPLERGEIRKGEVIAVWPSYVVMDINAKREGFVPKRDLNRLEEQVQERVDVGAEFPVYVVRPEDYEGRAIVSISRGLVQEDWDRARVMLESEEIWEGEVVGSNRGGLLVQYGRLRGFVPASHVVGFPRSLPRDEKRRRLTEWIGRHLGLRVIEVNQRRNRLVLSERAAHGEWREQQMERLLKELERGQLVKGRVSNIQPFGAFVDLGGADGLVHISELAWKRIDSPQDVVQVGEEIEVKVIKLDHDRKRISLSLRLAGDDPWEEVEERYTLGQLVDGLITRVVNFGAFAELEEGIEGLVHISELAEGRIGHPSEVVEEGEVLPLRVIRIDPARRRIGLSFRRVTAREWEEWKAQRMPPEEDLSLLDEEEELPGLADAEESTEPASEEELDEETKELSQEEAVEAPSDEQVDPAA